MSVQFVLICLHEKRKNIDCLSLIVYILEAKTVSGWSSLTLTDRLIILGGWSVTVPLPGTDVTQRSDAADWSIIHLRQDTHGLDEGAIWQHISGWILPLWRLTVAMWIIFKWKARTYNHCDHEYKFGVYYFRILALSHSSICPQIGDNKSRTFLFISQLILIFFFFVSLLQTPLYMYVNKKHRAEKPT